MPATPPLPARSATWQKVQPWATLVVRLGIAATALWAAVPKLSDLAASQRSVHAYQVLPWDLGQLVGIGLPIVELAIGLLALVGLLTRPAAIVFGALMVVFIVGIAQAWARGLDIDCGCFGVGGERAEGLPPPLYWLEILRDVGFLAMAAFVTRWPRCKWSLDHVLRLEPVAAP